MATDVRALPAYLGDDATFRTWAAGIEAQLVACGLVVHTDTGQLVIASATRPGTSANAGFRMYRFSDTLQATKPIFVRVKYGIGTVADRPQLWIAVGTATDGAGGLLGQTFAETQKAPSSSKSVGNTLNSYCSGGEGRIMLVTNLDSNPAAYQFNIGFVIDRSRDADGTPNSVGYFAAAFTYNSVNHAAIPHAGSIPTVDTAVANLPCTPMAVAGVLSTLGTNVALSPFYAILGRLYPLLAICAYKTADIGALTSFTATWLGATHTFMPLGVSGPAAPIAASMSIAMVWE